MEEYKIRAAARDAANDFFNNMAVGHPDEITVAWLMKMHPELDAEEAEEYRKFCQSKTFVFRGCYGDGEWLREAWRELKSEIHSL